MNNSQQDNKQIDQLTDDSVLLPNEKTTDSKIKPLQEQSTDNGTKPLPGQLTVSSTVPLVEELQDFYRIKDEQLRLVHREERPFVRLNMITSFNAVISQDGRSWNIGSQTDHQAFRTIRSQADAVLVGATTVTEENFPFPTHVKAKTVRQENLPSSEKFETKTNAADNFSLQMQKEADTKKPMWLVIVSGSYSLDGNLKIFSPINTASTFPENDRSSNISSAETLDSKNKTSHNTNETSSKKKVADHLLHTKKIVIVTSKSAIQEPSKQQTFQKLSRLGVHHIYIEDLEKQAKNISVTNTTSTGKETNDYTSSDAHSTGKNVSNTASRDTHSTGKKQASNENSPEIPSTGKKTANNIATTTILNDPVFLDQLLTSLYTNFGIQSIVCEGGPTLNGQLLNQQLVDEVCATVAFDLLVPPVDQSFRPVTPSIAVNLMQQVGLRPSGLLATNQELLARFIPEYRQPR